MAGLSLSSVGPRMWLRTAATCSSTRSTSARAVADPSTTRRFIYIKVVFREWCYADEISIVGYVLEGG